ncbi:MAG TPA: mechanosensitive ion channel protein MscS [Acidimicrobiaceae bacterium]|nr:mechanosensitive ion channel protein MscS [Acidimicrobiaceae bacterium]
MRAVPLFQVTDEQIVSACEVEAVDEAGLVCRNVYTWTENDLLARVADWLATVPLRILIIFVIALVVNRLVRRAIGSFVANMTDDGGQEARSRLRKYTPKPLQSTTAVQPLRAASRAQTIGLVLKSTASIVIYSIAVITALAEVGINLAPLIAGAGIVGVALGFGAQSLVKDFLSGLFMLAEDQYGVGDVIDVGEAVGTVEVVNLRTTKLRGVDGTVWHVPNGEIRRVGNMSQQWARALLDVEVAYSTDLGKAEQVVKEVADKLWREDTWRVDILEEPEIWGIQTLGASGIAIRLVVKTQPGRQWAVSRELNRRIKDRFDEEGIEIPFPQQVMWVRREAGSSTDSDGGPLEDGSEGAGDEAGAPRA